MKVGTRLIARSGTEMIVTRWDISDYRVLSDGNSPLHDRDTLEDGILDYRLALPGDGRRLGLGKRYRTHDGRVEVLIIKPGVCNLNLAGEPLLEK